LIEIVASLALLTISQAYGESLTGYGVIQLIWDGNISLKREINDWFQSG